MATNAHVGRVDDPLLWGVLPLSYAFDPSNHRWSLGSYDICFQNKYAVTRTFHTLSPLKLISSQISVYLLHSRPSPPDPPRSTFPYSWGSFPANNNPMYPPPLLPTFLNLLPPSNTKCLHLPEVARHNRSLHKQRPHIHHKRRGQLPRTLSLHATQTLMDPHLPRRSCSSTSTKVSTLFQMGHLTPDPRIRTAA